MRKLLVLTFAFISALAALDLDAMAAGGCGPGFHRGPYGHCRRNFAEPGRHPCPRGFYLNRFGRCRANGH